MMCGHKRKTVDPYFALGLPHSATASQIKKRYRKLAMQYHPDRWMTASTKDQDMATTKFATISEAYALLSDADRKRQYDHIYKYGGFDDDSDGGKEDDRDDPASSGRRGDSFFFPFGSSSTRQAPQEEQQQQKSQQQQQQDSGFAWRFDPATGTLRIGNVRFVPATKKHGKKGLPATTVQDPLANFLFKSPTQTTATLGSFYKAFVVNTADSATQPNPSTTKPREEPIESEKSDATTGHFNFFTITSQNESEEAADGTKTHVATTSHTTMNGRTFSRVEKTIVHANGTKESIVEADGRILFHAINGRPVDPSQPHKTSSLDKSIPQKVTSDEPWYKQMWEGISNQLCSCGPLLVQ